MSERAAQTFDPARIRFVLVEPRRAGNIGAAARALANLGYSRLEIVRPAEDPKGVEARRMAVHATTLIDAAGVHASLAGALAGARTVVGTTARTGKQRKPHWRIDRLAEQLLAHGDPGEIAFVFGREDHGLSDDDLDRCTHLAYLPADENQPSFNLAQALLLVAWELRRAELDPPGAQGPPATDEEREAFYRHFEEALRAIGYVTDQTAPSIMRRLRRIYGRAAVTEEELATLRGMARQILWAADKAGL
ncbi:MAG: TrmJ/YjtD family RNA methyltransferase [Acidobacteria bacterium]|nr:TrmJ/YjtD family RNA methyltransferase [Acidobacteriota bacterium]NIM62670.1 TrmJ/YjtD family RNA methyltransferase [Acidobacteriota bacterium]NIO59910.1 TrmJ/YjtD family RNA methyltransferase [Acidobacteriota bacterium]NIQ86084.1 TrmJ/YjtD family RNA methyltransferase [Acidobacteriota bacterium]NIT11600.1 TrmJ/YjtD family RNA methyltransferase [Acidobacteriota bacterium]